MARAIFSASSASAMAVFMSTPSAPSSMAIVVGPTTHVQRVQSAAPSKIEPRPRTRFLRKGW